MIVVVTIAVLYAAGLLILGWLWADRGRVLDREADRDAAAARAELDRGRPIYDRVVDDLRIDPRKVKVWR